MSLNWWPVLVATGCSSPDAFVCGPDRLCGEEEPKAQHSAQGLLSMGSFVHRAPGSRQEAPAQKLVKPVDTSAQLPLKSTTVSLQEQAAASAPDPRLGYRPPRKSKRALAQVIEKNRLAQGKGSKMRRQNLAPLSSEHHDSNDDDILKNEGLHTDLVAGFSEDLGADEGASTDVVQALESSTNSKRCTPCEFELYTQKDCKGVPKLSVQLECGGDLGCAAKYEVPEGAKVVSIKATRKACVISIKTDTEKHVWFGRSWRDSDFPGCVNLHTENYGYPEEVTTTDMIFCRKRTGKKSS